MAKKNNKALSSDQKSIDIPPVIAVLGHVDHGKTTLLDAIRKTSIAEREHGGITQKIGASKVEVLHDKQKRYITFIDTPGHAAFSKMRGRGAMASDIGLLVISAADGVMPQTKESIQLLKASGIPFIVVFTKSDLESAQIEKVKQQVIKEGVLLEGFGGDTPYILVSAKTGSNIKELLDLILLVFDLHPKDPVVTQKPLGAIVIESRLDQKSGPRATIVVKEGTIRLRDELVAQDVLAKVRTLTDDIGNHLTQATVGDAVEILGFEKVPAVGSIVSKKGEEKGSIVQTQATELQKKERGHVSPLSVIVSADTLGSLEAILAALPKDITVVSQKTGEISEADVLLAKSTGAIILGFNTKVRSDVEKLAFVEKVLLHNYTIIYELIDEVKDALEGKLLAGVERILGQAKILATFPFEKTTVLGIKIVSGRVAKGDKVRIERDGAVVGESTIVSLRIGKEQISKVETGKEAGIIIFPLLDFTIGDMVICHG